MDDLHILSFLRVCSVFFFLFFYFFFTIFLFFFFFNDTATTEIYTLSLHDALPIWGARSLLVRSAGRGAGGAGRGRSPGRKFAPQRDEIGLK